MLKKFFRIFVPAVYSGLCIGIGGMAQAFSSQKNAESGLNKLTMWVAIVFFITTFLTGFKIVG